MSPREALDQLRSIIQEGCGRTLSHDDVEKIMQGETHAPGIGDDVADQDIQWDKLEACVCDLGETDVHGIDDAVYDEPCQQDGTTSPVGQGLRE